MQHQLQRSPMLVPAVSLDQQLEPKLDGMLASGFWYVFVFFRRDFFRRDFGEAYTARWHRRGIWRVGLNFICARVDSKVTQKE